MKSLFFCLVLLFVFVSHPVSAERQTLWLSEPQSSGASVSFLAAAPSAPGVLYALTVFGVDPTPLEPNDFLESVSGLQMYRSNDAGATWNALPQSLAVDGVIRALIVSPSNPDKLLIAFDSFNGLEVTVSANGGQSWLTKPVPVADQYNNLGKIMFDPNQDDVVYALINRIVGGVDLHIDIYKSEDAGLSWFKLNTDPLAIGNPFPVELIIDPQTGHFYAIALTGLFGGDATATELYKSSDDGSTWITLANNLSGLRLLAADPVIPDTLYALQENFNGPAILSKSTDGGSSWTVLNNTSIDGTVAHFLIHPSNAQQMYVLSWYSTSNPDNDTFARSDDGGLTWQSFNVPTARTNSIALNPSQLDEIYLPGGSGVWTTTDGGASWSIRNQGMTSFGASALIPDPRQTNVLYRRDYSEGWMRSDDYGRSWRTLSDAVFSGLAGSFLIHPQDSNILYANEYRSTDGGQSWQRLTDDLDTILELVISPSEPNRLYALTFGSDSGFVYKLMTSVDGGQQWTRIQGNGFATNDNLRLFALAVDSQNADTVYVAQAQDCYLTGCSRTLMLKTSDAGGNWQELDPFQNAPPGADFNGGRFSQVYGTLHVDQQNPSTLYFFNRSVLLRSQDGGLSWETVDAPSAGALLQAVAIDPNAANTLYVGTSSRTYIPFDPDFPPDGAVYRSRDGGDSWTLVGRDDPNRAGISSLNVGANSKVLHAGTLSEGRLRIAPDYPVMWWDTNQSGQGVQLWPRANDVWGVWSVYGELGQARWFLFHGEPQDGLLNAPLLSFQGPALGMPFTANAVTSSTVGQVTLDLKAALTPQLQINVNGIDKALSISPFRPQADAELSGVWWDPNQAGHGMMLSQQGNDIWGFWTTYDNQGDNTWFIYQGQLSNNTMTADLLHYTGPALQQPWQTELVTPSQVGTITLTRQSGTPVSVSATAVVNGISSVLNLVLLE